MYSDKLRMLVSTNFGRFSRVLGFITNANASIFLLELIDMRGFMIERDIPLTSHKIHGDDWLCYTMPKMYMKTTLTRDEQETSIAKLKAAGLIEVQVMGAPSKRYFRLCESAITEVFNNPPKIKPFARVRKQAISKTAKKQPPTQVFEPGWCFSTSKDGAFPQPSARKSGVDIHTAERHYETNKKKSIKKKTAQLERVAANAAHPTFFSSNLKDFKEEPELESFSDPRSSNGPNSSSKAPSFELNGSSNIDIAPTPHKLNGGRLKREFDALDLEDGLKRSKTQVAYGKYVFMRHREWDRLVEQIGEKVLMCLVERMEDYCRYKRPKGYADYAAALRQWARRDAQDRDRDQYKGSKHNKQTQEYIQQYSGQLKPTHDFSECV